MGLLGWILIRCEWCFYKKRQFEHGRCTQRRGRARTAEMALCKSGRETAEETNLLMPSSWTSSLQNWGNQYLLGKPPSPNCNRLRGLLQQRATGPFAEAALSDDYSYIAPEGVLSLKKEGDSVTCYNTCDPWGYCAKWNKDKHQSQKDKFPLVPFGWGIESNQSHRDWKLKWWFPGAVGGKNGKLVFNRQKGSVLQNKEGSGDGWWW